MDKISRKKSFSSFNSKWGVTRSPSTQFSPSLRPASTKVISSVSSSTGGPEGWDPPMYVEGWPGCGRTWRTSRRSPVASSTKSRNPFCDPLSGPRSFPFSLRSGEFKEVGIHYPPAGTDRQGSPKEVGRVVTDFNTGWHVSSKLSLRFQCTPVPAWCEEFRQGPRTGALGRESSTINPLATSPTEGGGHPVLAPWLPWQDSCAQSRRVVEKRLFPGFLKGRSAPRVGPLSGSTSQILFPFGDFRTGAPSGPSRPRRNQDPFEAGLETGP